MGQSDAATAIDYDNLQIHPLCGRYRPMNEAEMARLTESLRRDPLRKPILIHDGLILDGRSRWTALKAAGIPLRAEHFEEWDGSGDLETLLKNLNEDRRHLTDGELLELAVADKDANRRKSPDARADAARKYGVSAGYISDYEAIRKADPEVARAVVEGKTKIPEAKRQLGLDRPRSSGNGSSRRSGPDRVLIDVKDPEEPTRLEDIEQDIEERRAIQEDLSDEDWVRSLPLFAQLAGKVREGFVADALTYRDMRPELRALGAKVAAHTKGNRRPGPFLYAQRKALECNPPEDWARCPDRREGGCGGVGKAEFGGKVEQCGLCHGAGYLVR